jgi:hypothetical protein
VRPHALQKSYDVQNCLMAALHEQGVGCKLAAGRAKQRQAAVPASAARSCVDLAISRVP